jgi:hypothetical protein
MLAFTNRGICNTKKEFSSKAKTTHQAVLSASDAWEKYYVR